MDEWKTSTFTLILSINCKVLNKSYMALSAEFSTFKDFSSVILLSVVFSFIRQIIFDKKRNSKKHCIQNMRLEMLIMWSTADHPHFEKVTQNASSLFSSIWKVKRHSYSIISDLVNKCHFLAGSGCVELLGWPSSWFETLCITARDLNELVINSL